ncbi:MAG: hypothetical protein R6X20_00305 [Phycisphaerae bacterium]
MSIVSPNPGPDSRLLKEPVRITGEGGLVLLNSLLHDEMFDLEEIRFDEAAHTVTMPVRRQFHSGSERLIRSGLLSKTYEKDWMRSVVTLRRVRSWEVLHDQGINSYSFNVWRLANGVLEVQCCESLLLRFEVDSLDVEVEDTGFKGKARIKRGPMGIESSTGRVYE